MIEIPETQGRRQIKVSNLSFSVPSNRSRVNGEAVEHILNAANWKCCRNFNNVLAISACDIKNDKGGNYQDRCRARSQAKIAENCGHGCTA